MNESFLSFLFFIGAIIVFGFSFAFEYIKYGQTGSKNYNFLSNFPYELNSFKRHNKGSYLLLILELFASILFVNSGLFFALAQGNHISAYIIFVLLFIGILAFNILRFIKLTNLKAHMAFTAIFTMNNILIILLEFIFFTNSSFRYLIDISPKVFVVIILLVLLIFEFILMINKSYKDWFKLVKLDSELYARPKICYIAILEWGNFLIYILTFVSLFIVLYCK